MSIVYLHELRDKVMYEGASVVSTKIMQSEDIICMQNTEIE